MAPDFWLILGDDITERVTDHAEITGWLFEAESVWKCCPSDGTMRDVTEDEAHAWWEATNEPYDPVPPMFKQFLEDEIQTARERREDPDGELSKADRDYDERIGA